jgi:hypothetical protein
MAHYTVCYGPNTSLLHGGAALYMAQQSTWRSSFGAAQHNLLSLELPGPLCLELGLQLQQKDRLSHNGIEFVWLDRDNRVGDEFSNSIVKSPQTKLTKEKLLFSPSLDVRAKTKT